MDRVRLPKNVDVNQALQVYRNNPDVEYAEPNYRFKINVTQNDTHFNKQWALHNTGQYVKDSYGTADADIDAPEAWDILSGVTNVIVAVIDTGIAYNHPDLAPNIWINPGEIAGDGIDNDGDGRIDDVRGWDFVENDNDPMDPPPSWHSRDGDHCCRGKQLAGRGRGRLVHEDHGA